MPLRNLKANILRIIKGLFVTLLIGSNVAAMKNKNTMTVYQLMQVIEAVGYAEVLLSAEVLNKQICARYARYKRFFELFQAHPDEKKPTS